MNNAKTMRVFISQPMAGKTPEQIKAERDEITAGLESEFAAVEIIDSYFEDFDDSGIINKPLAYLAKSLSLLATADLAVFAHGWPVTRGCKIEYDCATAYGIATRALV
jgi:hypothetical protein